jgi:hypothetical protein
VWLATTKGIQSTILWGNSGVLLVLGLGGVIHFHATAAKDQGNSIKVGSWWVIVLVAKERVPGRVIPFRVVADVADEVTKRFLPTR